MPTLTCTRSPSMLFHRSQGHSTASRLVEMLRPEDGHACLPRFAISECLLYAVFFERLAGQLVLVQTVCNPCAFFCSQESVSRKLSSSFRSH